MTDAETAAHLRAWCANSPASNFAWSTDACGYTQHCRFVAHRNKHWNGGSYAEWIAFVLAYADSLDADIARLRDGGGK